MVVFVSSYCKSAECGELEEQRSYLGCKEQLFRYGTRLISVLQEVCRDIEIVP